MEIDRVVPLIDMVYLKIFLNKALQIIQDIDSLKFHSSKLFVLFNNDGSVGTMNDGLFGDIDFDVVFGLDEDLSD